MATSSLPKKRGSTADAPATAAWNSPGRRSMAYTEMSPPYDEPKIPSRAVSAHPCVASQARVAARSSRSRPPHSKRNASRKARP